MIRRTGRVFFRGRPKARAVGGRARHSQGSVPPVAHVLLVPVRHALVRAVVARVVRHALVRAVVAARDTPRGQSPRLLMSYLYPYGMPSFAPLSPESYGMPSFAPSSPESYGMPSFAPSSPESPFPGTGDFGAGVKSHPSSHLRSQQRALAMVSGSCTTMLRGRVSWTPEMALPELTFHAAMVLYHRPTGPRT